MCPPRLGLGKIHEWDWLLLNETESGYRFFAVMGIIIFGLLGWIVEIAVFVVRWC